MSKNATCGRGEETKKVQKLSCIKLAICPDHPRRRKPLKFCMRGRVREVVIYFKFHENRSRGLRAVEGRKSPSPIDTFNKGTIKMVPLICQDDNSILYLGKGGALPHQIHKNPYF